MSCKCQKLSHSHCGWKPCRGCCGRRKCSEYISTREATKNTSAIVEAPIGNADLIVEGETEGALFAFKKEHTRAICPESYQIRFFLLAEALSPAHPDYTSSAISAYNGYIVPSQIAKDFNIKLQVDTQVLKFYENFGWFDGSIISIRTHPVGNVYYVKFEDGDGEEFEEERALVLAMNFKNPVYLQMI